MSGLNSSCNHDCHINAGLPYLLQFFRPNTLEDSLSLCEAYVLCNELDSALSVLSQAQTDIYNARKRCVSPGAGGVCSDLIDLLEDKKDAIRALKLKKLQKCNKIMNFMEVPPKMSTAPETPLPDTPPRMPKTATNENNPHLQPIARQR